MTVPRTRYLKQFASRRREIVEMARAKGNAAAAVEFGISRERVRQIREAYDKAERAAQKKALEDSKPKRTGPPKKRAKRSEVA